MSDLKTILIVPNGIREVNPIGLSGLKEEYTLDDDSIFYYKYTLSGSLTFIGEDFSHLYTWDRSLERCEKGTLIVTKYGTEILRYTFGPDLFNWDVDKCTCSLNVTFEKSSLPGYEQVKDIEYNVFELVPTRVTWQIQPNNPGDPIFFTVENGVWLHNTLEAMLNADGFTGMKIVSEFFGWNAAQTYTIGNSDKMDRLILAQNSDIYKRRLNLANPPTEPAITMKLSLSNAFMSICSMFNMKCDFESPGVFRIEHITWFTSKSGPSVSVTSGNNLKLNDGRLKGYEYDNTRRYANEVFKSNHKGLWNSENGFPPPALTVRDQDWTGLPIEFDTCNSNVTNTRELRSVFNTDIITSTLGPDRGGIDVYEGIFIGAVNSSNDLYTAPSILGTILSTSQNYNILLGWAYLAKDYHLWNKSFKSGKVNGVQTSFTVRKYRVQKNVRIEDCHHLIDLIGGDVTTPLGVGKALRVRRRFGDSFMEVDVYYDVNNTSGIGSPTAVDDSYSLDTGTYATLNTSAQALSSLIANDTPSSGVTVYVETKSTTMNGVVQISSNGHFIYTPPANYQGIDTFDYHLIQNGLVSTATCTIEIT